MNSKRKGSTGEREWASFCREQGFDARRGQQYSGANGDADVVGLTGIHQEVKRVERLCVEDAMIQSRHDALPHEMPIVAHRRNHENWKVTMDAEDWFKLYREWCLGLPNIEGDELKLYLKRTREVFK